MSITTGVWADAGVRTGATWTGSQCEECQGWRQVLWARTSENLCWAFGCVRVICLICLTDPKRSMVFPVFLLRLGIGVP